MLSAPAPPAPSSPPSLPTLPSLLEASLRVDHPLLPKRGPLLLADAVQRELLVEAGFKKADAYWEGTDDDDEGNGEFVKSASEENEDAWIAYVVGVK